MSTNTASDFVGKCEECGKRMYATGRRHSYGETAVTAHGPQHGETHIYCAPCWHGRPIAEYEARLRAGVESR
jgi:hypothetical protein